MSIQTDLSVAPYFDDFKESKNYNKILFKPSVAVQTRELNQLQTILQNQIERFGDNIFTKGTIINGCNFQYYTNYPYVKIRDLQGDLQPVAMGNYTGLFAKNGANLVSQVLEVKTGYESLSPDLNTLFVKYLNSGTTYNANAYSADDVLTLYDANNSIFKVVVPVGGTGQGFSNSDSIVFMSAMTLNHSINVGDTINDPVSKANGVVVSINTTAVSGANLISVRPYANSLTNTSINSTSWTFTTGNTVLINNTVSAGVTSIIGSGATATPVTDGVGKIKDVLMITQGDGYIIPPYATIKTSNTTANVAPAAINLTAQNYLTTLTVANNTLSGATPPTGSGFAFGVSEGVIYQKGYFLFVNPQTTIVSKYTNKPDEIAVGFSTSEEIINSNIDNTLLDNASGSLNYQAPGADRLKLTPELTVISAADALGNTDFFTITQFSLGQPYLQNQETQYSKIGDKMAQRTYDSAGDYVLDNFMLTTKTAANTIDESGSFRVTIDPGEGYVSGYKVKTTKNYSLVIDQGIDDTTVNSATINLAYGNYVLVDELGGTFDFTLGDLVTLYDTAKEYLTTTADFTTNDLTAVGTAIGTARIRSLVLDYGVPGTPSAVYRMYLYDINMYTGYNFRSVKSIRYTNATYTGIADTVLSVDPATNEYIASVANTSGSAMIFDIGSKATHTTANIAYSYRTIKTGNTSGTIEVSLSGDEYFQYTANAALSGSQLLDFDLTFTANAQAAANLTGTVAVAASGNNWIIGSSTTFVSDLVAGDYVKIFSNTITQQIRRVDSVVNNTLIIVNSNTTVANASTKIVKYFPEDAYVSLSSHGVSANIDSSGQLLTIDLNETLSANVEYAISTNILVVNATPSVKTSNRDTTVKINIANNASGNNTVGPWCLGVPDIFRLKSVRKAVNTAILAANTSTYTNSTFIDVTNDFYIDHNQNLDYYDYGYLYKKPRSNLALANNEGLIVVFDHFTNSTPGFFTIDSYSIDDTKTYSQLNSTKTGGDINTNEIPELYTTSGKYIDLIDSVDFRPRVVATANTTAANVNISTTNPAALDANNRFGASNTLAEVGFPVPDSRFISDLSHYLGRVDRIVIDKTGRIYDVKGKPSNADTLNAPAQPADTMTINLLYIPPYPNIPQQKSTNLVTILDKGIANEKFSVQRDANHEIAIPLLNSDNIKNYQARRYSMQDIQTLEKRIAMLEKQAALTQLETQIKDLTIPSSLDPGINRFKYGFFADDFKTSFYSDILNPEYNASIINNEVVAKQYFCNFEFKFANTENATGKLLSLPYGQHTITSQLVATSGPVITYPARGTYITQYCLGNDLYYTLADGNGGSYDELHEANSPTCGGGTTYPPYGTYLRTYCGSIYDKHDVYANGSGGEYEVVTQNSPDCGKPIDPPTPVPFVGILTSNPDTFTLETTSSTLTYYTYAYYGYNNYDYGYSFQGGAADYFVTTTDYYGYYGGYNGYYLEGTQQETNYYFSASQSFTFTATGLKPLTEHTFYFDGADLSSRCQPFGKNQGDALVTDASGQISFTFYYDAGTPEQTTDYSYAQSLLNNLAGDKVCTLTAPNSQASKTIRIVKGSDYQVSSQPTVTTTEPVEETSVQTEQTLTLLFPPGENAGWYDQYGNLVQLY